MLFRFASVVHTIARMHPLRHATRFHFPYFPIAWNGKYRKCCVQIFEVQRLCVSSRCVCECVDVCMFTSNGEQLCVLFTLSLALSAARSLRLRFPLRMFVCWFGEATVSVLNDEPTNRLVACMHRTKRSCKQFKISVPSSHTYFAVRSNNSREFVFFYNCWSSTSTQHTSWITRNQFVFTKLYIASLSLIQARTINLICAKIKQQTHNKSLRNNSE